VKSEILRLLGKEIGIAEDNLRRFTLDIEGTNLDDEYYNSGKTVRETLAIWKARVDSAEACVEWVIQASNYEDCLKSVSGLISVNPVLDQLRMGYLSKLVSKSLGE